MKLCKLRKVGKAALPQDQTVHLISAGNRFHVIEISSSYQDKTGKGIPLTYQLPHESYPSLEEAENEFASKVSSLTENGYEVLR